MSMTRSIAVALTAAAAMLAVPSAAVAVGPPAGHGDHRPAGTPTASTDHPTKTSDAGVAQRTVDAGTSETPGAHAPATTKAKAYGKYCKGQSKKHVEGQKGTPFSRCVTAMAKVATGETTSARAACANLSRKHTADGRRGTPFSRCVAAARKLADQPALPARA